MITPQWRNITWCQRHNFVTYMYGLQSIKSTFDGKLPGKAKWIHNSVFFPLIKTRGFLLLQKGLRLRFLLCFCLWIINWLCKSEHCHLMASDIGIFTHLFSYVVSTCGHLLVIQRRKQNVCPKYAAELSKNASRTPTHSLKTQIHETVRLIPVATVHFVFLLLVAVFRGAQCR